MFFFSNSTIFFLIQSKGPVNGHVATNEATPEPAPKVTPKSSREGRPAPANKEKLSESKTVTKKDVKQDSVGDKKKKVCVNESYY